jgi:hypothetical protein
MIVYQPERGEGREAIGERALRDDRRDPPVGRPDGEHVAAGERAAEQADALRIDPVEVARVRQRAAEVSLLAGDVDQLAGLAAAGAEVAVIEQQHPDPGRAEALGVGGEAQLLGPAEAVRHHHQRPRSLEALRPVQPTGAPVVAGAEGDIGAHRVLLGVRRGWSSGAPT